MCFLAHQDEKHIVKLGKYWLMNTAFIRNKNTEIFVPSLGEVELKYVAILDLEFFMELLTEQVSDQEFVIKVLFNQLLQPTIEIKEFQDIPEPELNAITTAFIENESHTFQYYENTGNLFKDFRQAIDVGNKKRAEELLKIVSPIIKSAQVELTSFQNEYGKIIQQSLVGSSYVQDALADLERYSKHIIQEQIAISQQLLEDSISPILNQFQSVAKMITESLRPQIDFWQKWLEQNQEIFTSFTKYWTDFQQEYDVAEHKAVKILQKYKWFIAPSIPISIVFQVISFDREEGRQDKAINQLFIQHFADNNWRNLTEMVSSWNDNPLFKKRRKIFSDCVDIIRLCDGKDINEANVVLPTLITQIDGIMSDYLNSKGISWDNAYDDWVDQETGRIKRVGRKSQLLKNSPRILTPQLDDLANDIFLNILFQRSQKGKPLATPFNFNRHKIIHGEITWYGRKDYLIRAFMVLDMLAHF